MPDAYVIEVFGRTAGIVVRDSQSNSFNFFSAAPCFSAIEGQCFSDPLAAERAARMLAQYGSLPRRGETEYSRPNTSRNCWIEKGFERLTSGEIGLSIDRQNH